MIKFCGHIRTTLLLYTIYLIILLSCLLINTQQNDNNIKINDNYDDYENIQVQYVFYNRANSVESVPNPYKHYTSDKVCIGTDTGLSSTVNNYKLWKTRYENCSYLSGNLEIQNFKIPKNESADSYDFSFLENITEITGYLLVFNSEIKTLPLKNLKVIRGWGLFQDSHSVYIDNNDYLSHLDFRSLKVIQNGTITIKNNTNLCHMNDINWKDLFENEYNYDNSHIDTSYKSACSKCDSKCCYNTSNFLDVKCPCWESSVCQNLSRVICDAQCDSQCYGKGNKCCNHNCIGCTGPTNKDCLACKKFLINDTGVCVDSCPKREIVDPKTGRILKNKDGMFQYGVACVKSCPKSWLIYGDYCVKMCPANTSEADVQLPGSNETHKECVPCTKETCPKICRLEDTESSIKHSHLEKFKDCELFDGNFKIIESLDQDIDERLTEADLEVFSRLRVINGYFHIQSENLETLNFLRNLEYIHARNKFDLFGMIIRSRSLKTLNLKSLKKVSFGEILISASNLCLVNTINWKDISSNKISINGVKSEDDCYKKGYKCAEACKGCWSAETNMCQYCEAYKFGDSCINSCNSSVTYKGRSVYVENEEHRICNYCHEQCKNGCRGPTEYDCVECSNAYLSVNDTNFKCLNKCPLTHYQSKNECKPCHPGCDGCSGPKKYVAPDGCKSCSAAIVDNDNEYTMIECINIDLDCPAGTTETKVPKHLLNLSNHPLKGKRVCRKCNSECLNCNGEGSNNCVACKNFNSTKDLSCKSECTKETEYPDTKSKLCLPCNSQCSGCYGPSAYECTKCRGYKLKRKDAEKLFDLKQLTMNPPTKSNSFEYYCVEECPKEFQYLDTGKLCSNKKLNQSDTKLIIGLIVGIILIATVFACFGVWFVRNRFKRRDRLRQEEYMNEYDSNVKPNLAKLKLIKEEELEKCNLLGKGAFGSVYGGVWNPTDEKNIHLRVAIKELKSDSALEKSEELIDEAKIMASVDHPYCLRLIALCIAQPVMLITQLLPHGSVLNFFDKHKDRVTEKMLLTWCSQIAEGMNYLESREIVHRDLAARNVLVKSYGHVKITDFGLAKVLNANQKEFYAESSTIVPIRWLAPECIEKRLFTHKSDVWSYGITCWELFTFGARPFDEIPIKDFFHCIKHGTRLAQPVMSTIDVYMLLIKCWLPDPSQRPQFLKLADEFKRMSNESKTYLQITPKCFEEPLTTAAPNVREIIREFSRETQMTNVSDYDVDDGISMETYEQNTVVHSIHNDSNESNSTQDPTEDSAFLAPHEQYLNQNYVSNDRERNKNALKPGRYTSDPLTSLPESNRKSAHLTSQSKPIYKPNVNKRQLIVTERQDSACFSANFDEIEEERLIRSSKGSSSSSNRLQSESTNSNEPGSAKSITLFEDSDQSMPICENEEYFQRNVSSLTKPQNICSNNLLTLLKDSPIYNKTNISTDIQSSDEILNNKINIQNYNNNNNNTNNNRTNKLKGTTRSIIPFFNRKTKKIKSTETDV